MLRQALISTPALVTTQRFTAIFGLMEPARDAVGRLVRLARLAQQVIPDHKG
jgi:hypothetical protein